MTCVWFWVWAIDGALGVSALDAGALAAGPALLLTAFLVTRRTARESASGLLTGAGLPLLFVAYMQRAAAGLLMQTLRSHKQRHPAGGCALAPRPSMFR